ncbi:MAG TPA: thrombospondin type 3 repeat-containing protein [Myxococcales bacterium]|nr:thrombospondin type 3 repeat-containing protein [Myxococcales bacterium]
MSCRSLPILAACVAAFASTAAFAQANPECTENLCGSPKQNGGGGCGCGGGSVLYNYTDDGTTFSYTDDADGDGIPDNYDNCPFVPNRDQKDSDGDGVGDACDNCPTVFNPDQKDSSGLGKGDACNSGPDDDLDGDGIPNKLDNCPTVPNPDQKITCTAVGPNCGAAATLGDLCNPDIDGDGIPNAQDNCPYVYNPAQDPGDPAAFEAQGLNCSNDSDGDGVPDTVDNCPTVKNADQKITCDAPGKCHGDYVATRGDACNPDIDGDGIPNDKDNCPTVWNPDQADTSRSGVGDACNPHFCLVVDQAHPDKCLDPNTTFAVGAGLDGAVATGMPVKLPLFANRKNVAIRYSWTVVDKPSGAGGTVQNAVGAVTYSSGGFQYYYLNGHEPTWTPDVAGTWRLRLHGELVFDDKVFPGVRASDYDLVTTVAEGSGGSNCATGGAAPLALVALGLFALRRRRSA